MIIQHVNKEKCCGCSACYSMCPLHCISIIQNEKGFYVPEINGACVNCGKCLSVCPMQKQDDKEDTAVNIRQEAYAAITKDERVWESSSSGGAFSEICKAFDIVCKDKTAYVGAVFEEMIVVHKSIVGLDNIGEFRRSKYIQSYTKGIYNDVKNLIYDGYSVVFSGTPCQVSALKRFLGKDADKVFYIDFICHGVGSPGVFARFIKEESKKNKKTIVNYSFRIKNNLGDCYLSELVFENNSKKIYNMDSYNRLFFGQLCTKESCTTCKWRTEKRTGDITIADFKNMSRALPNVRDWRAHSTIVFNSKKSLSLKPILEKNMDLTTCDIEIIKKHNPLFYRTTQWNRKNSIFFDDYVKGELSIDKLANKYCGVNKKGLIRRLFHHIPAKYRWSIIKGLGR